MFSIGSIASAIPLLNTFTSSASPSSSKPQSGLGGIVDQFVAPVASAVAAATHVVAPFEHAAQSLVGGVVGSIPLLGPALQGSQSGGALPSGLRAEVNILKVVVAGQGMDAKSKANIQSALDQVKAGKPLTECLSSLSGQEKTLLADTIGNAGFEPPECLTPYLTNKSQGDSSRMDCALKNVEVAEEKGYQATEASTIFGLFPLAGVLLGG